MHKGGTPEMVDSHPPQQAPGRGGGIYNNRLENQIKIKTIFLLNYGC